MAEITETLCPFCNGVLDIEMFNGGYGCDTGCDYVRFEVECPHCHKVTYETGTFGEFDASDEQEYRAAFMAEWATEVQKINARKAREREDQARRHSGAVTESDNRGSKTVIADNQGSTHGN